MWFEAHNEQFDYRKKKARYECPIVAVTAYQSSEVIDTAIEVGIKKVLFKPVTMNCLTLVIDKYYKNQALFG